MLLLALTVLVCFASWWVSRGLDRRDTSPAQVLLLHCVGWAILLLLVAVFAFDMK